MARRQTRINVNIGGLKKLTDECRKTIARVGVLGSGAVRDGDSKISNYDLVIIHEFGCPHLDPPIPRRSFLEMPIDFKRKEIVAYMAKQSDLLLKDGNVLKFFQELGAFGMGIVIQAFDTRGFGTWEPNTEATIRSKGGKDSPLIDTGNLRKHISWDVKKK